jgi:hypothetical protein
MNMPTKQVSPSEQTLMNCVQEQSTVFADAVQLIERLEKAALRRELGDPDSVSQLQQSLNQVVSAQQKVSTAYAAFSSLRLSPSTLLKDSLARHEQLLKILVDRIYALQSIFETLRDNISPQLDIETRRKSMHTAYQKSLKTV